MTDGELLFNQIFTRWINRLSRAEKNQTGGAEQK